jgi:NitT/TauT family transport system substrate-binding protein
VKTSLIRLAGGLPARLFAVLFPPRAAAPRAVRRSRGSAGGGSARWLRAALLPALAVAALHADPAQAQLKVGVSDWTGWAAWYIAEQKGFFKKHGADVKLIWFPNYSDSISALSTGQLDANSQTWSDTLGPLYRGIPIKVVLVNDNSAGNDAVMAGPQIKDFAGLKGKTVALEQFSVSHFVFYTGLEQHGLTPKDVKVVNLSAGDAAAAFISGRVDGAVVWNPWISQIENSGKGHALFTSKEMPGLIPDLLVAQEKAIKDKRKDLVGMVQAWFDVVAFVHDHPDESVKILAKVVGMKAEDYKVFLPGTRFFDAAANAEAFDPKSSSSLVAVAPKIAGFLMANKLIDGKPDASAGVDRSVFDQAVGH